MDLAGKSVLVVCGGYRYYGAEAATLSLMKVLVRAGARVECFTSKWSDGQFVSALAAAGFRSRSAWMGWFYARHPYWTLAALAMLPDAWRRFRATLRELQPDLVIHSSYRSIAYFYPLLGRNNVLCVHDKLSVDRQASWILPKLDRKVSRYLPVSEFVASDLRASGLPSGRIDVLHNCTEIPERSAAGNPDGPIRIGIVGQVVPTKGHVTLMLALGELRRRGKRFRLAIFGTGSGEFVDELRRLSRAQGFEGDVEFRGFVPDKARIYEALDLVVVPSLFDEPFGLAALEPAAYGIPVIASAKGGLPEVVEDGRSGYLFPAGDSGRMAELIGRVMDSPEEAHALGAHGRMRAQQQFSESAMLDRLRAL